MKPKSAFLFVLLVLVVLVAAGPAVASFRPTAQEKLVKVKVSAEQANLREKPDISSTVVQQIPEGTILEADKKEGEWFHVSYTLEDGGVIGGWIHESLVVVVEGTPAGGEPARETRQPERRTEPRTNQRPAEERAPGTFAEAAASPFEIALSFGGGAIDPDDLNAGSRGLAGYEAAFFGIPASGTPSDLRMAWLPGIEVSYRVTPWLAVGLSLDYVRGSRESAISYGGDAVLGNLTTRPGVRLIPLKAGVRFYPGSGIYFRGSLGYYTETASYFYRIDASDQWQEWKGSATGHALGAEFGVGGDWAIGRRTGLFAEVTYRMVSVDRLTGSEVFRDSTGQTFTTTGDLWRFSQQGADLQNYSLLFIRAGRPSGEGVSGVSDAALNMSGMVFRAGVRFRF